MSERFSHSQPEKLPRQYTGFRVDGVLRGERTLESQVKGEVLPQERGRYRPLDLIPQEE